MKEDKFPIVQSSLYYRAQMITCKQCNIAKPIECFYNEPNNKDGVKHKCKTCCLNNSKNIYTKMTRRKKLHPKQQICICCDVNKTSGQFFIDNRKKNGLDSYCKLCRNTYNKKQRTKHMKKRRMHSYNKRKLYAEYLDQLKTNRPCADCGRIFPSCSMDFDHIKGHKKFSIGSGRSMSKKKVLQEINKCELVCANCHRVRTKLRHLLNLNK